MAPVMIKYFIGRPALAATATTMTRSRPYSKSAKGTRTVMHDSCRWLLPTLALYQ